MNGKTADFTAWLHKWKQKDKEQSVESLRFKQALRDFDAAVSSLLVQLEDKTRSGGH